MIGPWLAGTFDSDKSVARTAQDALDKSFPSPDKQKALWKVYKDALLEHVEDAIVVQSQGTLSDERTTSPDDAEAKYVRVVGTAMHILGQLLRDGKGEQLLTAKLWQFAYHEDPYLRRGVCALVVVAKDLDWSIISTCFISKALHSSQVGSARQFTQALVNLTERRPELWTTDYSGKTAVSKRLSQFLRQGSQGGPEDVWKNISTLLRIIPEEVINDSSSLAEALKTGAAGDRINAVTAWLTYVDICLWLSKKEEDSREFIDQHLMPIVVQYVTKRGDEWTANPRVSQTIITAIDTTAFEKTWNELIQTMIDDMKLSQPETSKDFRTSQDAVIAQAQRLLGLKGPYQARLLEAALQLLISRNGKPYGAAGIVELVVQQPEFEKSNSVLQAFLEDDLPALLDSPSAERLINVLVLCGRHDIAKKLLQHESTLCYYVSKTDKLDEDLETQLREKITSDKLCIAILRNQSLTKLHHSAMQRIENDLSPDASPELQLASTQLVENLVSAGAITDEHYRSSLLSKLLVLSDMGNERATALITKLNSKSAGSGLPIIQQQLNGQGTPLSIFTLVDLAKGSNVNEVVPSAAQWRNALAPYLDVARPLALTITSPLQGARYQSSAATQNGTVRDMDDFSLAFRLILYVLKLDLSELTEVEALQQYLPLALQLVNEKLTIDEANEIWTHSTPEVIQEAVDTLNEGNRLLLSWLDQDTFLDYWLPKAHSMKDYPTALAWTYIVTEHVDRSGPSRILQEYDQELKTIHRSSDAVQSAAILAVLREHLPSSTHGKRVCNELVANATDRKPNSVILLNVLLQGQPEALETIPAQRMVFLLKSLVSSLLVEPSAELMKLLSAILPLVSDIYGDYWEHMIASINKVWSEEPDLPTLNASLRLYARLKNLLGGEVNEDLQEAWSTSKPTLHRNLFSQLELFNSLQAVNQPVIITAELLRRQLGDVDIEDDVNLYQLLASPVEAVQSAAFEILHRTIPKQQEQLSLDVVLEGGSVNLPDRLFELLDSAMPRQYLLAWNLIFDHFAGASFKLQEAYSTDIKKQEKIDGLLTYVCEELQIVGRPVDASKFDIQNFELESERETVGLTIHVYYNCLLYLPGLTKEWFISQKNRVKSPLETWTQRYISPLIMAASLAKVNQWATTQDDDDHPLMVKSSVKGSELVASIAVDPENPPISLSVSLPGTYPLESPSVTSRTRVGVSEKNWLSWLRTIQIIIFSTGSIIEGLIAFRKNVQGVLKGHSECAICYSIIGTDMQTPNKKCGTCKNTFHGTCLFRWFRSSNSSSCPLCRNNFNYA